MLDKNLSCSEAGRRCFWSLVGLDKILVGRKIPYALLEQNWWQIFLQNKQKFTLCVRALTQPVLANWTNCVWTEQIKIITISRKYPVLNQTILNDLQVLTSRFYSMLPLVTELYQEMFLYEYDHTSSSNLALGLKHGISLMACFSFF